VPALLRLGETKEHHVTTIDDWNDWHRGYDDPSSELAMRMSAVQSQVREVVDAVPPGPVTVVSLCGGQGRELVGALAPHPRRAEVRGRLVELDPQNAAEAHRGLELGEVAIEVVNGDASQSDAYAGLPPVDLVVASGVWGHLDEEDQRRTIGFLRQLCVAGAAVVWTGFRRGGPERIARLRATFREEGFDEELFVELDGEEYGFTVATSRFRGEPDAFVPGVQLFTFGSSRA
jgi:hypothetical protein